MKNLSIAAAGAATLGLVLSMSIPVEARMQGRSGVHGMSRGGMNMGQASRMGVGSSRSFAMTHGGGANPGRLITGRSVSAPSAALGRNYSGRMNGDGYGAWNGGAWYPGAMGAALAYPYDEDSGYAPYYYQTGAYAQPMPNNSYGNYCATEVKTCLLYGPAAMGVSCSCRVSGGRAYGAVTE
jgi:hypothetical protein